MSPPGAAPMTMGRGDEEGEGGMAFWSVSSGSSRDCARILRASGEIMGM